MKNLKFSEDYEKLPLNWKGTQAMLLGVSICLDMEKLKLSNPQLFYYDTKFRNKEGYFPITFKEGVILTFFHYNSKTLFTTFRRYTEQKYNYYKDNLLKSFSLNLIN